MNKSSQVFLLVQPRSLPDGAILMNSTVSYASAKDCLLYAVRIAKREGSKTAYSCALAWLDWDDTEVGNGYNSEHVTLVRIK